MADIILTPLAELIVETLATTAVKEFKSVYGARDELSKLEKTLLAIRAVLADAEKRQIREERVKDWLKKLEDVLYDADDLVDRVNSEGLRRELMPGKKIGKKVRTFFSCDNQLVFRHKVASRIKDIRERLAAISADKEQFDFAKLSEETQPARSVRDDSHSFVVKKNVVGRDKDRRAIVKLLLDPKNRAQQAKLSVIPIVGMGGLGKTTLAQLVFNDASVQQHFDLTIWVCVSNDFSVKVLCEKIIRTITKKKVENLEMEQLQEELRKQLERKRYLLVLDDVWSEEGLKWIELKDLLTANCSEGSRIIVTTRLHTVANVMSTMQPYDLGILDPQYSWNLFKKMANYEGIELSNQMVLIAKEVLKKCAGLPLAIRMIASVLLSSRNPEIEWPSFLKKELSNIPQVENQIIQTLRLSFNYLPSHLKPCFAYCSLFPKDHKFDVQTLISFWLAQGFIRSNQSQSLEEIGYEYFKDLLWRSFFQEAEKGGIGNMVTTCKMHDLVHDLAIQVAGEKYATLASCDEYNQRKSIRHVFFDFNSHTQLGDLPSWLGAQKLRSFLIPSKPNMTEFERESIWDQIISNCKFLRMLDLRYVGIKTVPDSIGKLKHLRHLDLYGNYMETLPASLTNLVNLHTLKLQYCPCLRELPSEIEKLVNLRHLELSKCNITHMPRGLSQLNNLQTLSLGYLPSLEYIKVNESDNYFSTSSSPSVSVLPSLRRLELIDLPKFKGWWRSGMAENQAEQVILPSFPRLSSLKICCCPKLTSMPRYPNIEGDFKLSSTSWNTFAQTSKSEETSSSTTFPDPLSKLTSLSIIYVEDLQYFPNERLKGLASLKKLDIWKCHGMKYLSSSVQYLTSLKELVISGCNEFEGFEWLETPALTSLRILNLWELPKLMLLSSPGIQYLTSLKELSIIYCEEFEGFEWPETPAFTSLRLLTLSYLPKLKHLSPPGIQHLTSLEELEIDDCKRLQVSNDHSIEWQALTTLRRLKYSGLPQLVTLPEGLQFLTTLQKLSIQNCVYFTGLPDWICKLSSLQTLYIWHCPNFKSVPASITSLTSLQYIEIGNNKMGPTEIRERFGSDQLGQ